MGLSLILLFTFIASNCLASNNFPSCQSPQKLRDESMNPQAIQGWLKTVGSNVDSIDQLICCLPSAYQENYIIGHSSISAQPGVPSSPRVMMFDFSDPSSKSTHAFVMSANGGHPWLKQSQNLELMYFNPRSRELEYYDLVFEKGKTPHLSERNPSLCMNCHGDGTKDLPDGPKPIFDQFGRWNRFVGGRNVMCSQVEREYFHKIDDMAVDATKTLPRFKCLNQNAMAKT